jgi:hypothetical protein
MLEASWITRELADAAMFRRVDAMEGRDVVCQKGKRDCAGVLIPYYRPSEPGPINYRIRRDNPEYVFDKKGKPKPDRKYLGPPKSGNKIYVPPEVTLEHLSDVTIPIALTEGEEKALALWRLANHETDKLRFIPIAIAGVWNWRGVVAKANGPNGERVDIKGPIPDLRSIEWKGRKVFIVFDSNVHSNDSVKWARKGIARELAKRGAEVDFINLPEDCGVNGIDDLLAAWGPDKVLALFDKPVSAARLEVLLPPQFQKKPTGMFRVVNKGGVLQETQLSNYVAWITSNITIDDGLETRREFEIKAKLLGRTHQLLIPSTQFATMDWPIEQMGPAAITYPNQKEYVRTAIQSFSFEAEERRIYAHTGWREIDGRWMYLDAVGAVGAAGRIPGIDVRLPGALRNYGLRIPSNAESLINAVRASLRVTGLGPAEIGFPLLAVTYRSVFGDADFSLHLAGPSGAFKSEAAALSIQHFGSAMGRLNLPASWSSTGNALEMIAFSAKDSLLTIDDFAPQGSAAEVARYHTAAERVFRAAGNRAGRGRLDSTARLREPKPPRSLILSTGEDIPRGYSVRARLLILELSRGDIDPAKLTCCQHDAQSGLYAEAMGAYVRWLAEDYEARRASFLARADELRSRVIGSHARTPEMIASLYAAFELFLGFAAQSAAITEAEREALANTCWNALLEAARAQEKHHAAAEPTERFLALLRACLVNGRAHLADRTGGEPALSPEAVGWRRNNYGNWEAQGNRIGWVAGPDIYLELEATYMAVQMAGRDMGELLSVGVQTLKKRLREKGLLASIDEKRQTLTVRRILEGSKKDVLNFLRSSILPDADAHDGAAQDTNANKAAG